WLWRNRGGHYGRRFRGRRSRVEPDHFAYDLRASLRLQSASRCLRHHEGSPRQQILPHRGLRGEWRIAPRLAPEHEDGRASDLDILLTLLVAHNAPLLIVLANI